jgi:hypothetical protein
MAFTSFFFEISLARSRDIATTALFNALTLAPANLVISAAAIRRDRRTFCAGFFFAAAGVDVG